MSLLGLAAFFLCMVVVMTGILQAGGKERLPLLSAIIGGVVKITANIFLLSNPNINIYGAALSTLLCYVVMATLDFLFLKSCLGEYPNLLHIIPRPLVSTIVMAVCAFGVYSLCNIFSGNPGHFLMTVYLAISMGAAVIVYAVMIIVTRSITAEDMKLIPKGEKIAKLLRMK